MTVENSKSGEITLSLLVCLEGLCNRIQTLPLDCGIVQYSRYFLSDGLFFYLSLISVAKIVLKAYDFRYNSNSFKIESSCVQ